MLAHAYVPWQCYDEAFSPQEALKKGTLFPSLYGVYPIPR
nr:spore coat associated protein CotJA [Pelosinus baikalensis]